MSETETPAGDVLSMCSGKKCCPVFTKKAGGVCITDEEKLGGDSIELDAEQGRKLREWLQKQGF